MPPLPNNVTFATGSNPQSVELNDDNDHNDSLMDQMLGVITDLFNTAKDNFNDLLQCPGGQRRGWKILDGNSPVEFAPCGCYDDALWPLLLGIPAAAKAGGTVATKILVKKARKKFTKEAIKKSNYVVGGLIENYYKALKGIQTAYNKQGLLLRKVPPVKPGYRRLYRGQGARWKGNKPNRLDLDLKTPLVDMLDIDNPNFKADYMGHFWTDSEEYAQSFADAGWPPVLTNESQVFFMDIPIDEAEKVRLYQNTVGTVDNLAMLPGQKYPFNLKLPVDPTTGEYYYPPDIKVPLRRRNEQGVIEIVTDTPVASKDMDLNPSIFTTNMGDAQREYYLDSSMYGTNYLDQATREANLYSESAELAFQGLKGKTKNIQDLQSNLDKLLGDPSTPDSVLQDAISKVEDATSALKDQIDELFDTHNIPNTNAFLKDLSESSFAWSKYLKEFLPWFLGLLAFIEMIMSLVTIVKDKSCIPLMEGGLSEFSNKPRMAEIRNQRIGAKASVWAELNKETCECSECPADWNFCDHSSITNLYLKETNSCIPPCCGDQEFKPITLISTCKCDCPPDKVWMPCKSSDCTQSDSLLTSIFNPSSPGKCVHPNPDPEKLEWDDETCEWKCKTNNETPPPSPVTSWIFPPKTPIKPCASNKPRLPPHCECSGSYSSTEFNPLLNIATLHSIRLL